MTAQMIVRVDSGLKAQVQRLARAEGRSVSDVVRELLEAYVKDRDIGLYIDDLWQRIGNRLTEQGTDEDDIERVIREVRKNGKK